MNVDKILEVILYAVPALITGLIAFYFFREHTKNEEGRRRFLLHKDLQSSTTPVRLQAYERMVLFLERIKITKLLVRVQPTSSNKKDYETLLIATIEQEFEHNLTQQIYVGEECWNYITAAKNATIKSIRTAGLSTEVNSADKLRETILTDGIESLPPSDAALSYIKEEVNQLFGN